MADNLTLTRQEMKDPATAHLRIYVGGIVDKATIDELYEHFAPYGKINGIVINRNFGFIQFETETEAQEAIAKCDGSVFQGKALSVRTAQTQNTFRRTEPEVVTVLPEKPPAVALMDNIPVVEETDDMYDSYGNFIGDLDQGEYTQDASIGIPPASAQQGYNINEEFEEPAPAPVTRSEPVEPRGGGRGRARGAQRGAARGRGARGRGAPAAAAPAGFHERSPVGNRSKGEWMERSSGFDRFTDYPPRALPVPERNDCEIIVVSKTLTEYAEYIEDRLKRLGIVVDLLFPMEDVPIGKVLGNIASRGCLYAILVMPQNQEHRSLTLTILHGLPQEHRNMPIEDALQLLSRNFQEVQRGGPSGREAVYALLGQLADGRTLTVLQYDKVIEYLQERREQQVKIELGEPLTPAPKKTEMDLQQRILSILNDKTLLAAAEPTPAPLVTAAAVQNKLLNDPTVRKALDSILQKMA